MMKASLVPRRVGGHTVGHPSALVQRPVVPCTQVVRPLRKGRQSIVTAAAEVEETAVAVLGNGKAGPINVLDSEDLSAIIKVFSNSDIVELELKSKRFALSLRKKAAIDIKEPQVIYQQAPSFGMPPPGWGGPPPMGGPMSAPPAAAAPSPAAAPAAEKPAPPSDGGVEFLSPMAGTFYRSPAPGEPAFKQEGDPVKKGEKICIIEAMKLMNEIEADSSGTIVKFLVENGKGVFPNTPLCIIKP